MTRLARPPALSLAVLVFLLAPGIVPRAQEPSAQPVTVTLVRWPFT